MPANLVHYPNTKPETMNIRRFVEFNKIEYEIQNDIAIVRFNDPTVMNAIGNEMLAELSQVVGAIARGSTDARCLLITGNGRGFCSGANLSDSGSDRKFDGSLRGGYHPVFLALRDLSIPVVTAVNGAAAGVGMSFAMMGDIVCASRNAFFLQAFAKIGLVPDGGSTFMLPRLIGWGRAVELSMLAERLPAEKAFEWGLVNRLYDDNEQLLTGSMEIASKLSKGPTSLGLIRKLYWATWHSAYEQQLDMEARLQSEAGRTKDNAEGVAAFLEKRDPQFKGH